jgi:small subunit ribosomal protein S4
MELVKKSLAEKKEVPSWLQKKAGVGKMIRLPKRDEIGIDIAEQLIVEYYSR